MCDKCGKLSKQKFFVHYEDGDDYMSSDKCKFCQANGHYTYYCKKCPKK